MTVLLRLSLIFFFLTGCSGQSSTPVASWRHADDGAYAADVSADASLAVVSSVTGGISVWDLQKNEKRYTWQHQGEGNNLVANVHIAFDNSYVVTSDRDAFALWSITSGEPEGFWQASPSTSIGRLVKIRPY